MPRLKRPFRFQDRTGIDKMFPFVLMSHDSRMASRVLPLRADASSMVLSGSHTRALTLYEVNFNMKSMKGRSRFESSSLFERRRHGTHSRATPRGSLSCVCLCSENKLFDAEPPLDLDDGLESNMDHPSQHGLQSDGRFLFSLTAVTTHDPYALKPSRSSKLSSGEVPRVWAKEGTAIELAR